MNQKYVVFNDNGSIFQFFTSEKDAVDFVKGTMDSAVDDYRETNEYPKYVNELCVLEIKYIVQRTHDGLELIQF